MNGRSLKLNRLQWLCIACCLAAAARGLASGRLVECWPMEVQRTVWGFDPNARWFIVPGRGKDGFGRPDPQVSKIREIKVWLRWNANRPPAFWEHTDGVLEIRDFQMRRWIKICDLKAKDRRYGTGGVLRAHVGYFQSGKFMVRIRTGHLRLGIAEIRGWVRY